MDPSSSPGAMQQLLQGWPVQNPYMYGQTAFGSYLPGFGSSMWDSSYAVPPLAVRVEGLGFHYQLTDDDVRKVFARYGDVQSVDVQQGGNLAYVQFLAMNQALAAIQDLDGKTLAGLKGGKLRVAFDGNNTSSAALAQQRWSVESQNSAVAAAAAAWGWGANGAGIQQYDADDKKYTCKVEFGIENDTEFRVSSKVIAVARRIWKDLPNFQQCGGKTRLRGRGSGFREGPNQEEADEDLHLCISCRDHTAFEDGVSMAVREIQQIQRDYIVHCKQKGLPVPKNLGCKVERQTRTTADG